MMGDMKTFTYYYFLARKYGRSPSESAYWAKKFCEWWVRHDTTNDAGYAPRLDFPTCKV